MQKLIRGDCIQILKQFQINIVIDAVITDPPYNISRANNLDSFRKNLDFGKWDKSLDLTWIDESIRLLHPDGSIIIFSDWVKLGSIVQYAEARGLINKGVIRWEKSNPYPLNIDRRYVSDCEFMVWFILKGGKWTFNRLNSSYNRPKIQSSIDSHQKLHPTQKPVYVMERLLRVHTNPNDLVLDCFMGSGTTGVACHNLDRRFIGIEKDRRYFAIAKKRLGDLCKD